MVRNFKQLSVPLLGHAYVPVETHHKDVFAIDIRVSAESQDKFVWKLRTISYFVSDFSLPCY